MWLFAGLNCIAALAMLKLGSWTRRRLSPRWHTPLMLTLGIASAASPALTASSTAQYLSLGGLAGSILAIVPSARKESS